MELLHLACFLLAACAVVQLSLADETLSSAADQKPDPRAPTDDSNAALAAEDELLDKRWPQDKWAAANNWRKKWMALSTWGKRWTNQFATWGKRSWNERPFVTWGKRTPDWSFGTWGKRAWNDRQFATWGKRPWSDRQFATWGKRPWSDRQFATWGKRAGDPSLDTVSNDAAVVNSDLPEKKAWNQFVAWGKRTPSDDVSKRWNSMATWGKRSSNDDATSSSTLDNDQHQPDSADKRWNSFATWGKKWSTMSSWGKRDSLDGESPQKKWKNMATWGKRDSTDAAARDKRSSLRPWGKRVRAEGWAVMPTWGKRGRGQWGALSTWGKRSAGDVTSDGDAPSANDILLRLFDRDGNNSLDLEEFDAFLNWMQAEQEQDVSE